MLDTCYLALLLCLGPRVAKKHPQAQPQQVESLQSSEVSTLQGCSPAEGRQQQLQVLVHGPFNKDEHRPQQPGSPAAGVLLPGLQLSSERVHRAAKVDLRGCGWTWMAGSGEVDLLLSCESSDKLTISQCVNSPTPGRQAERQGWGVTGLDPGAAAEGGTTGRRREASSLDPPHLKSQKKKLPYLVCSRWSVLGGMPLGRMTRESSRR